MKNETLFIVLKYAGSMLAGFYGIYATLTNFREDKAGRKVLTTKGYVGIGVLFAATLLSLSTNAVKDYQDHKSRIASLEEARRKEQHLLGLLNTQLGISQDSVAKLNDQLVLSKNTATQLNSQLDVSKTISTSLDEAANTIEHNAHLTRNVLNETDRILHPLNNLYFSYILKIPLNSPLFEDYRKEFRERLPDLLLRLSKGERRIDDVHVSRAGILTIGPNSSLFPKVGTKEHKLLNTKLFLNAYRTPVRPEETSVGAAANARTPDLRILVVEEDEATRRELEYSLTEEKFIFVTRLVPSDRKYWIDQQTIVSVKDFLDSHFVIHFWNEFLSRDEQNHLINEARQAFELDTFFVNVSGTLFFAENLEDKRFRSDNGLPAYFFHGSRIKKQK